MGGSEKFVVTSREYFSTAMWLRSESEKLVAAAEFRVLDSHGLF